MQPSMPFYQTTEQLYAEEKWIRERSTLWAKKIEFNDRLHSISDAHLNDTPYFNFPFEAMIYTTERVKG